MNTLSGLTLTLLFVTRIANAQMNATTGFDFVGKSMQGAKENVELGHMNLKIIEFNVFNIKKAQQPIVVDQKRLDTQRSAVAVSAKNLLEKEKQLKGLIAKEQANLTKDQQKIDQLLAVIESLKKAQDSRNHNIDFYKDQLNDMKDEKANIDSIEESFKATQNDLKQRQNTLTELEKTQVGYQKKTQAEVKEWETKYAQQKRSYDSIHALLSDRR